MSPQGQPSAKVCVLCGQDCSTRPRVKDQHGRYYCRECHEKEKQSRTAAAKAPPPAAAAKAPTPAAVPPIAAGRSKPKAPPAPRASSDEDQGFGLMDALGEAEASAADVVREQCPCPSCRMPMPKDAVICMRCGFNKQLGRRMGEAQIEGVPTAEPAGQAAATRGDYRHKSPAPGAGRGGGFLAGKEWLAGAVPFAVFVVLGLAARMSPIVALAFIALWLLFLLSALVVNLVFAFMDGLAQGFLCLCLPPYYIYWLLFRNTNAAIKWVHAAVGATIIFGQVLAHVAG
jgi:hypothetical protein